MSLCAVLGTEGKCHRLMMVLLLGMVPPTKQTRLEEENLQRDKVKELVLDPLVGCLLCVRIGNLALVPAWFYPREKKRYLWDVLAHSYRWWSFPFQST